MYKSTSVSYDKMALELKSTLSNLTEFEKRREWSGFSSSYVVGSSPTFFHTAHTTL